MDGNGRIGTNPLGKSEGSNPVNASPAVGLYGESIAGRPRPKRFRSARTMRRVQRAGVLIGIAAAILIVSAVAMVPSGSANAAQAEKALGRPPGTPFALWGYTYDSDGVTPLVGCNVLVTDTNTGEYTSTVSIEGGYYAVDLGELMPIGWNYGDLINVTATFGMQIGWSEAIVADHPEFGPMLIVDVVLNAIIPEFPMVIVPVVGIMALVVVVGLRRRDGKQ